MSALIHPLVQIYAFLHFLGKFSIQTCQQLIFPLIRVNPGSIFGWGLIFIFEGLVNLFF
jgi:hypothetical protein